MKRRLPVLALCLFCAGRVWALEANSRKLADRYLSILEGNPAQPAALERLWKIYHDAGEGDALKVLAFEKAAAQPVLAAAILQQAGWKAEAEEILRKAADEGQAGAAEVLAGRLAANGDAAGAAGILEKVAQPSPATLIQLGVCWRQAGDETRARAAWERAATLSPADPDLRRRLARAAAVAGDREAAAGHYAVVARQGSPSERFEAWQEISRLREAAGEWTAAIQAQEELLALMGPGHWQLAAARRRLLTLHREAGLLDDLEKKLRQSVVENPRDGAGWLRLAELQAFSGREADRLASLRRAGEIFPSDEAIALETASLELAAGEFAAAAALYDRVLAARPRDGDVIFLRAEVAALSGDEKGAEQRAEDFLASQRDQEAATERVLEFYRRMRLSGPLERRLAARRREAPADEAAVIELARFYLAENRDAEAVQVFSGYQPAGIKAEDAAATAFRFSEILKQARLDDEALAWAKTAARQDPRKPEYALYLAEILLARNEGDAAREVLQAACLASPGLPREDLDRRLYLLLQPRDKNPLAPGEEEMRGQVENLKSAARRPGAPAEAWLRLARWLRWSGDPQSAAAALREGLAGQENSRALREALAAALGEAGDTAGAIQQLEALAEKFPAEAPAYRRRIGLLELDRGNGEAGLKIFSVLASQREGEWQALADLALAEQVAGNWFQAFETWHRAHTLAPAESRPGLRQPLLNAATRLQLQDRALDFLDAAALAEKNSAAREDILREAAAYAVQSGAASGWHDRLAAHLTGEPGERSWELGRVYLLEAEGRKAEAREALVDAQKNLAESAAVLEPLLRAAENAQDWEEAARLTRRLLALSRRPDPARSVQLARYLEQAGRFEEARAAWRAVASLHARDPVALTAAAEFFDRTGDEAGMESCYRTAAKFGNCAPQVWWRLGRLALERGDRSQALADFEAVLKRARPDPSGAKNMLPLPEVLADVAAFPEVPVVPGGWRRPPGMPVPWPRPVESENEGCRLLAIRQAGRLLANSPRKAEWLAQFSHPIERIWALHAGGEWADAFAEIEKLQPDPEAREAVGQVFASLLIEAGAGERLAQWASGDPSRLDGRWDMVKAALSRMLEAGWRPSGTDVFAGAPPIKRWQICDLLASRNFYEAACQLGRNIPDELPIDSGAGTSPASAAWLEFARWKIALRDPDGAIACLDRALACTPPSASLGSPLLAALRARWLLTPKALRENFEEKTRTTLEAVPHPGAIKAAAALFAALRGDQPAADRALAALRAELGSSGSEEWVSFVQHSGAQLENWGLPRLARELYRGELARDRALLGLRGQNFQGPTEALLIANQLTWATEKSFPYLLNEWLARSPANEELLRLADRLKSAGRSRRAADVLAALTAREPRDDQVKAGLLAFVDDPLTRPVAAAFLEKLLAEPRPGPGRMLVQNAALRLAALWEQSGEYSRSLALLERLPAAGAPVRVIAPQRVRLLILLGRHREALAEAEASARTLPAGTDQAMSLANLYAGFGRPEEARAALQKEEGEVGPARERAAPASAIPRGLAGLDREGKPPGVRFREGGEFLRTHPDLPEAVRAAELDRLRKMAGRDPALAGEFFGLRKDLAGRLNRTAQLETELAAEWNNGRGSRAAGETLLLLYLEGEKFAELGRLLDGLLADTHFNEPAWDQAGQLLLQAGQPELAARVLEALIQRAPGNANRALFLAEALRKSGRSAEAEELVFPIERLAALDGARRVDLARFELATGNAEAAKRHLRAGVQPADASAAALWIRLAGEALAAGKMEDAHEAILRALAQPQTLSGAVIAEYQARRGDLSTRTPGTADFVLSPRLLREFQLAAAARLAAGDEMDRAWLWLESAAKPLADAEGRTVLEKLEKSDPGRAGKLWESALAHPDATAEMRGAAARFFQGQAAAAPDSSARLALLQKAHEVSPGEFSVADACAREWLREGNAAKAKKVYQTVLDSFSSADDRRAAAARLRETPP